jgi:putative ABC transport system permease protein
VEAAGVVQYSALAPPAMFGARAFRLRETNQETIATTNSATPGYFAALATPFLAGRDFQDSDRWKAIVTDGFAARFGGPSAIIGKTLISEEPKRVLVVGVVKAPRYRAGSGSTNEIFLPAAISLPTNITFVVRVRGKAESYLVLCREAIRSVDPEVPVFNAATLEQRLGQSLSRPRFYAGTVLFFGTFALLLAVLGVYSAASVSIQQRTHEIGVRLAVGASHERLRARLLRESLLPVFAGGAAGVLGAIGLGRTIEHLISGAAPSDLFPWALAAAVLAGTAAIAIRIATRRIVRLNPMRILRAD